MHSPRIIQTGNLKWDAPPLAVDETELLKFRAILGQRPCWLAASTHAGEEDILLEVHQQLLQSHPSLLLIVIPRHPARGLSILANAPCRSRGEVPTISDSVYIADTIGELGLWYRLAPVAFIGGSLVPHGGQNMLEAARLGCFPIWGQYTANFTALTKALMEKQGGEGIETPAELTALMDTILKNPHPYQAAGAQAAINLSGGTTAVLEILNKIVHSLPHESTAILEN